MLYNATKSEKYALRVTVQHRRVSMNDNEKKELTERQRMAGVLNIVCVCIKYAEENDMDFQDVIADLLEGTHEFAYGVMLVTTIEKLKNKKYISGTVELVKDLKFDAGNLGEIKAEGIIYTESVFENIAITLKGKFFMKTNEFWKGALAFYERYEDDIKEVGKATLKGVLVQVFMKRFG